jgi:hypothetical protein
MLNGDRAMRDIRHLQRGFQPGEPLAAAPPVISARRIL